MIEPRGTRQHGTRRQPRVGHVELAASHPCCDELLELFEELAEVLDLDDAEHRDERQ